MTNSLVAVLTSALVSLGIGAYTGWAVRDASAQAAIVAQLHEYQNEADRQADIARKSENYLRDQLDRANAANSGVHLGAVRCSVSLRDAIGNVQTAGAPAAGTDGPAAGDNSTPGTGRDIGPDLERWAQSLTAERVRLRALQHFDAERAVK